MRPSRRLLLAAVATAAWGGAGAQDPTEGNAPIEVCQRQAQNGVEVSPHCGQRWVILNNVAVPEFWEVHELEFYWDRHCLLSLPSGTAISSKVNSAFADNTPRRAWDRLLYTKWSANCRALMGGCGPRATYVGKRIDGSWNVMGVNVDPNAQYASVRCVRVWQSPNISRQSRDIALGVFRDKSEANIEVLHVYTAFAGGAWQMRPPFEAGIWRLRNLVPTPRPWRVAELLLYSDRFCTKLESHGVPIASGSFMPRGCIDDRACDPYLPWKAFDGITKPGHLLPEPLPSLWQASCPEFGGCSAEEAWIGMDFNFAPVTIQCVRIYQPTQEGYPNFGHPTFASALAMEFWDGYSWKQDDVLTGLGHGGWNETRPRDGFAWRLSNFDRVPASWRVYELRLFESRRCGALTDRQREQGLPVDSNPKLPFSVQDAECRKSIGSCGYLSYDRNPRTAWESSCTSCEKREAWVGVNFAGHPREIRCFQLMQSGDLRHRSDAVELSMWNGAEWEVKRFESAVGGGTWNYRPSEPMSAWRFFSLSDTELPWTVLGIGFYSDSVCNSEILAQEIGSGETPTHRVSHAFDHDNMTEWEASCSPPFVGSSGCAAGSAWLGRQAASGRLDVRCLLLQQHRTRARQLSRAVLEYWDGLRWVLSESFDSFRDFGGGTWASLPGAYSSMWRLRSETARGGVGIGVAELELYTSSNCTGKVNVGYPSIAPISSGFASSREVQQATGSSAHFMTMGDFGQALPEYAFDGNLGTFWAELEAGPTWIGIDLTSQIADVQCVRFAFAGVRELQPSWSWMEAWDGRQWSTMASAGAQAVLRLPLPFPGGGGWQQRPAAAQSMWRLQNNVEVPGWDVYEVEFHTTAACTGAPLPGQPIASARTTPNAVLEGGHRLPARAFDADLETAWSADCTAFGCLAGNAWVGLSLHLPARVRCLRIAQGATRTTQVSTVTLAFWQGERWETGARHEGLGGGTWNMRPAMPDTLWRMVYMEREEQVCSGFGSKNYKRSWGVSELEFYADDACRTRLPGPAEGAQPIASGMRVPEMVGRAGFVLDSFSPGRAFDGSITSYWAAQCGVTGRDPAQCQAGAEWVGLDFGRVSRGMPVEVRCVRIHQSRNAGTECCDPASKLSLERWNGTAWLEATWRQLPRKGGPMRVGGDFAHLGRCPALQLTASSGSRHEGLWQKRSRRQSDSCAVPVSDAVRLISDSLCEKHPACVEAGFEGVCCPVDASKRTACDEKSFEPGHCSRCCCDVISDRIFEDEIEFDVARQPIDEAPIAGIELIAIQIITVMPFFGVGSFLLLYILAQIPEPSSRGVLRRMWNAFCRPLHAWLASGGFVAASVAFLCRRQPNEGVRALFAKRVTVIGLGLVFGGCFLWVVLSWLLAEVILRTILLFSVVILFAKSPFDPGVKSDRKRLEIALAVPFDGSTITFAMPSLGQIFATTAGAAAAASVYFLKGVMDIILMRFSLMAVDMSFATVEVPNILLQIPALPVDMNGVLRFIYDIMNVFTYLFLALVQGMFSGIPRCEGPVLVFSGMSLAVITMILIRWLNYDYFGLLTATKHTVRASRLIFQKTTFLAITLGIQTVIFVVMQCVMLLFARALMLTQFSSEKWMCPYPAEGYSVLTARIFLVLMAVLAAVITFLCANGHFMGQDFITRDFGKMIKMDLKSLDPKSQGGQGIMRFTAIFSMIPTTLGIWVDCWNVKGYLIKERAALYAVEMKYPKSCPHCGICHVPYYEIMKATAIQLSLAYQWFPLGALIGKACEYFNNPPLFYCGSELKCCLEQDHVRLAREGMPKKMDAKKTASYYAGLLAAHTKDTVAPALLRVASVSLYFSLLICTYLLDRSNLEAMGRQLFSLLMILASLKAILEFVVPVLALFFLGGILILTQRRKGKASGEGFRFILPIFGQLAHGVLCGMAVAIFLMEHSGTGLKRDYVVLLGGSVGILAGLAVLVLAAALERCPSSNLSGRLFMAAYSCALSVAIAKVGGSHLRADQQYVAIAFVALGLVSVTAMTLRLPPLDENRVQAPSAVLPLLTTARFLPGVLGSVAGVFFGSYWYRETSDFYQQKLTYMFGQMAGLCTSTCIGYTAAVIYAVVTDSLVKRRAGLIALLVANALAVAFGVAIHWAIGAAIGVVAGTLVGAVLEHFQLRVVRDLQLEPVRYTEPQLSSRIASSTASSGQEGTDDPPTVLRAWMDASPKGDGNPGLGATLPSPSSQLVVRDDVQVLATTDISPSSNVVVREEVRVPAKRGPSPKAKKYTMGRKPAVSLPGPRDPWEREDPRSTSWGSAPGSTLRPQSLPAARGAQPSAAMARSGSSSGTIRSARQPQPAVREVATVMHSQVPTSSDRRS